MVLCASALFMFSVHVAHDILGSSFDCQCTSTRVDLGLDIKKNFTMRVVKYWSRLPNNVVGDIRDQT